MPLNISTIDFVLGNRWPFRASFTIMIDANSLKLPKRIRVGLPCELCNVNPPMTNKKSCVIVRPIPLYLSEMHHVLNHWRAAQTSTISGARRNYIIIMMRISKPFYRSALKRWGVLQARSMQTILVRPENCAICEPSQTPSVLDPMFHSKYPTSTDPPFHRRAHPRNSKWVHLRLSYSLAHLEENGRGKGHQGAANCGR